MKTAFQSLLGVRLRHGFYASGRSIDDFLVEPSAATRRALADGGLIFRPRADGFEVYGEIVPDGTPPTLLRPVGDSTLRFQVVLLSRNPHLGSISALGEHRPGRSVYYFNNLRDDPADGRLYLGDSVAGSRVGEAIRLAATETYTHRFAAPVHAATLTLTDIFGNTVSSASLRLSNPADSTSEYRWHLPDVEGLVPGRYLVSDDQGGSEAFYYDASLFDRRPFAVIEIFSKTDDLTPDQTDRVPAGYRFLLGDELTQIGDYTLQLEPRSTTWRYNVIKKYSSNSVTIDGLSITGPIAFGKTVETERVVFTSSAAVALSETPRELALEHGGNKIRDLPNPTSATFLQAGSTAGTFVSDMYVYV